MSDNKNSIPSPTLCKLLPTSNKMYTPCRRVGLKRKSTGTLAPKTTSKKIKVVDETSKSIEFAENTITQNIKPKNDSILKLENEMPSNLLDKHRVIKVLKSELKNSEQHNLDQIKSLSKKWLNVCQEALRSLFNKLNENENSNVHTIEDLIKSLGICPDLIQFDSNNQEFYQEEYK
ncbi:PREDICTED: uncharacterized protein LOC107166025 [Diuraphis noxia]|uniref:uncharacterized protein LOC107166025 n=1 Tax=Diuraphis noxia TaxID=143948 RepID=UPI00076365E9|nr:PREDICTED: uncharacterized protein LOC107166025 [Diuraphis noxia]